MNAGQKRDEHWPVPKALHKNPESKQAFTKQRDRLKHTRGNLTLIADSLNPALSRSAWEVKKAELLKCSQPGLSRELHELEAWAEREILARGEVLGEVACGVWRYPVGTGRFREKSGLIPAYGSLQGDATCALSRHLASECVEQESGRELMARLRGDFGIADRGSWCYLGRC